MDGTMDSQKQQDFLNSIILRALIAEMNVPLGPENGGYHTPDRCFGTHCPFHGPSAHKMVEWPIIIRSSALVERRCEHGVGHPDPDSVAYFERNDWHGYGVHGCDGCCRED
jgi:hypothetical protein